MSEFKPTKPGWYWGRKGTMHQVVEVHQWKRGRGHVSLMVCIEDDDGQPGVRSLSAFDLVAPVVPLEDGPGVNAIQRQCLETALPTTTLEYCLLGLAGESGEVMTEADKGWSDEQIKEIHPGLLSFLNEFIEASRVLERWKKGIRFGKAPALPPLPDHCKPAIVKELLDVLWYGLVGLDRCGVSASQAFEMLRIKLQARKEAGTLAATTKREGE